MHSSKYTRLTNTSEIIKMLLLIWEAAVRRCSVKKLFLKISQNSQEITCARVSFLIKLQAPANSCEFCEVSKNIFFYRTSPLAASNIKFLFFKEVSMAWNNTQKLKFSMQDFFSFCTVKWVNIKGNVGGCRSMIIISKKYP